MLRKASAAILGAILGYLAGAAAGAALVALFSGNAHDKSVEMAMTGAFVTGPLGAVAGLIGAVMWASR